MSTAAFKEWVRKGRPWEEAKFIEEYQIAVKAAGWPAMEVGTIGDERHLQAEKPQDHTPFSVTGFPEPSPQYFVHAIDVAHRPDVGRGVDEMVAYWVAEARAGRTPWVKYIIFAGQRWDVRNGWNPVPANGHYDHVHMSGRTDWTRRSIGTWPVVKKGTSTVTTQTGRDVWSEPIGSPSLGRTEPAREWLKYTYSNHLALQQILEKLEAQQASLDAIHSRLDVMVDPQAVAGALAESAVFVDALAAAIAEKMTGWVSPAEIARTFGRALTQAVDE